MKCKDCSDFVNGICQKAQVGKLSELEGDCLLRVCAVLLRDIYGELQYSNDQEENGNEWKWGKTE